MITAPATAPTAQPKWLIERSAPSARQPVLLALDEAEHQRVAGAAAAARRLGDARDRDERGGPPTAR